MSIPSLGLKAASLCALLGACGRIGFDSRSDGDGGEPLRSVQHTSGYTPSGNAVSVPLSATVTANHVLVVATSTSSSKGLPTVTDSQGNAYMLAVSEQPGGNDAVAGIYVARAGANAATTITCALATADNIHCHVYEVGGASTTVEAIGTLPQGGPSLTVTTAGPTTTADTYVVAYFAGNNTNVLVMPGSGYGDAEYTQSATNDVALSATHVATMVGSQTATADAFGSTAAFTGVIVALSRD